MHVLKKTKDMCRHVTQNGFHPTETYCKGKSEPASVFLVQFSGSPQPEEEREVNWTHDREDLTEKKLFWSNKGNIDNLLSEKYMIIYLLSKGGGKSQGH